MKYAIISLLFLFPAFLSAQGTLESLQNIYQVKKGDTAYGIATSHGISLEELYRANPEIIGGKVKKGMFIVIPTKAEAAKQQQAEPQTRPVTAQPVL